MICKKCNQEIDDNATVCNHCNEPVKKKKPVHKRWWFWLLIVLSGIITIAMFGGGENSDTDINTPNGSNNNSSVESKIEYEVVDLRKMLDELDENALKAERTYQNKYVEVTGTIRNIDSDGAYISIEPVNADAFDFTSVMCYIKSDEQLDFIMEKSVGDTVIIKGKIKSIGEVLGYSLNIDEIK